MNIFPAAYIYVVMMENSTYYTMNGGLGQAFRQLLYKHLEDESRKKTDMGRFIHITLAIKTEVHVRRDMLSDIHGYTATTGDEDRPPLVERAILEKFRPIFDSSLVFGVWEIELSFSDFRPRVSRTGSLEFLCSIFCIIELPQSQRNIWSFTRLSGNSRIDTHGFERAHSINSLFIYRHDSFVIYML